MTKSILIAVIAVITQLLSMCTGRAQSPAAAASFPDAESAIAARLEALSAEYEVAFALVDGVRQVGAYAVATAAPLAPDGALEPVEPLLILAHGADARWRALAPSLDVAAEYNAWLDALSPELVPDDEKGYFRLVEPSPPVASAADLAVTGYRLPFAGGWSARVSQGPYGSFSHSSYWAVDFVQPHTSTRIDALIAAKDGVIWYVKDVSDIGGVGSSYNGYANGIVIKHAPDEYSWYWHLAQGSVPDDIQPGVQVEAGRFIGLQGTTGYSTGEHLHFMVTKDFPSWWQGCDADGCDGREMRVDKAPWSSNTHAVDFMEVDESPWYYCSGSWDCDASPVSENYIDPSNGVVLYFDANYRGAAWKQSDAYGGDVPSWIDNHASSVNVPDGWWAKLYRERALGGASQTLSAPLDNLADVDLDNAVSSVEIDASLWLTKALHNPWPWPQKVQIGTDDPRVTAATLNDALLFEDGTCPWAIRWLEPGLHTLTFRTQSGAYLGSNTATVEIQHWPYTKADCADDVGPAPPAFPPTGLDAAELVDETMTPDSGLVNAGGTVTQTWTLRNTGASAWNSDVELVSVGGDPFGVADSNAVVLSLPSTAPEETAELRLVLPAPEEPGEASGTWRLRNAEGAYFGPLLSATVRVPETHAGIALEVDPAPPTNTAMAMVRATVEEGPTPLRAVRLLIDGEVVHETNESALTYAWNMAGYGAGDHTLVVEAAALTDADWSRPVRQLLTYRLLGTTGTINHAPYAPVPVSPDDRRAIYSVTTVQLCAQAQGDPDGDAVTGYYFEIYDSPLSWNSGWVADRCINAGPLAPHRYQWRVKVRDDQGAESPWSATRSFTLVDPALTITRLACAPLDDDGETIALPTCTDAPEDADVTIWLDVNDADDGSLSGEWHRVAELNGPCFSDDDAPVWSTLGFANGVHRIRAEAQSRDPAWDGTTLREIACWLPPRRPAAAQLLAPVHPEGPETPLYTNNRTVTFKWTPPLRATSTILHVTAGPSAATVLSRTVAPHLGQLTHTFGSDHAALTWRIIAANEEGTTTSIASELGIDRTAPSCTVQALPSTTNGTTLQVNWQGTDARAGVRTYDIQVRDSERGLWRDWVTGVPASQTGETFEGRPGHIYGFRCRATDHAGNAGVFPATADTETLVDLTTARIPDLTISGLTAFPNPTGGLVAQAVVRNRGEAWEANEIYTDLYLNRTPSGPGDFEGSVWTWLSTPIDAGSTLTLSALLKTSMVPAATLQTPYREVRGTLAALTDSLAGVKESNELNNLRAGGDEICIASEDTFENDDAPGAASGLLPGQVQVHNLHKPGDEDWLRLSVVPGTSYTITTEALGEAADTYLKLFDTDGTTLLAANDDIATDSASWGSGSQLVWSAPEGSEGPYYVQVRHWDPGVSGCGTGYTITVEGLSTLDSFIYLPAIMKSATP
ncbi:MAG: NBR1-Ig-like domain-containing protein [Anaerolineae bacterium]